MYLSIITKSLSAALLAGSLANAEESWPTYRHDNARSGRSTQDLSLPLRLAWTMQSPPPQQAWTGPAKWDAYAKNDGLQSMRNFDPCYFTTARNSKIYFGSSSDNAVHCLDSTSGKELWHFFTEAAVRFPPTLYKGLAIVGSDDGFVYALDANSGKLKWKYKASPNNKRIPSNGKWISLWPIRTSVLIHNDRAIFGASLVPWRDSYLFAIDPLTGKKSDRGFTTTLNNVTLQGALLAGKERIYAPQGRAVPLLFSSENGKKLGNVPQAGGIFALLDNKGNFFAGPQNQRAKTDQVSSFNAANHQRVATFSSANRLVVSNTTAYLHTDRQIKAFNLTKNSEIHQLRTAANKKITSLTKKIKAAPANLSELNSEKSKLKQELKSLATQSAACWLWQIDSPVPLDLIATPNHIIAGFDGSVSIFSQKDGSTLWTHKIEGKAHGLTITDGKLVISTDLGSIITFHHK